MELLVGTFVLFRKQKQSDLSLEFSAHLSRNAIPLWFPRTRRRINNEAEHPVASRLTPSLHRSLDVLRFSISGVVSYPTPLTFMAKLDELLFQAENPELGPNTQK